MAISDGYYKQGGKPNVNWWLDEVKKGEEFRKKYTHESNWPMWRNYYRGEWAPGVLPTNVYFKMMRTMVPRIYYRNPSVSIIPSMPGLQNTLLAKLLERVDNKLILRMGLKQQMKLAVQQGLMFGTGMLKQGFGAQFTPTPEDLGTQAPDGGNTRVAKHLEYNDLVQPNMPWVMATHPGSIVIPTGTATFNDARWIGHWTSRPIYDVQADDRFENTKDLKEAKSSFGKVQKSTKDRPSDMVDLLEIRDKKTRRVMVIAPYAGGKDKVLFNEPDDLQISGGLPFYPIVFNTDDEVFWGVPDSQILDPQQREANEIRTLIMKHRRVSIAKILAKRGALSADEESKLIDAEVKAVIDVDGELSDVKELQPGGIPAGLLESADLTNRDVQEILGLGTNQFGEYAQGSADRSATEASIVNQATQIRIDERRDVVADVLVQIVQDMHKIIFEHWTEDIVVDIAGPAGVPIWVQFTPQMLRSGRYEVKVDPDTALPETKQLREQKAVQLFGLLKTNPLIDPVALTQFLLSNLYGVQFDSLMKQIPGMQGNSQENPATLDQLPGLFDQIGKAIPGANLIG